jgi:hypothetical protein
MASRRALWVLGLARLISSARTRLAKMGPGWGFAEDWVAGDVAGEEVGGELDAAGGEAEGFGETFDEFGFAEAWEALEEEVAAGEETSEGEADQFFFAEEDGFEGATQPRQRFCGGGDIGFARIVGTGGAHWCV